MDEFNTTGMNSVVPDPMSIQLDPVQQNVIDSESCKKWNIALNKYKAGKVKLEARVKSSERWWKLHNEYEDNTEFTTIMAGTHPSGKHKSGSSWLHNVVVSKHADAIEAYPQPNILPREESDKPEAWALSKIIPCILDYNDFEDTYDAVEWQKYKTGTGIYKVVWDNQKLNGMGDITIKRVSILNLFWQPGIEDIQDSRFFFHTEYMNKEDLQEMYPQLDDRALQSVIIPAKVQSEDTITHEDDVVVIDVYYKKRGKLHYAKYVGETVLYASENDPEKAERGFYDHGLYPYVFDVMYPMDGSPAGYGYIDICANAQTRIDVLNAAMTRNAVVSATPRMFERADGVINEEEFLDLNNALVHVNGTLSSDSIQPISVPTMSANVIKYLNTAIVELRETSGNTEVSTGSTTAGVTSASGIAAQQEASGKGSRAANLASYRAYKRVVNLVIELIRQFYDLPRQFRITGQMGVERFIQFQNTGMQPQYQGQIGGVDMGYRLPVYDIDVQPQKKARHQQATQNDLTLQLFGAGFFNPQNVDQALIALDMMEFDTKDELMQKLAQQGTMYQTMISWQMLGMTLAAQYRPDIVPQLSSQIAQQAGSKQPVGQVPVGSTENKATAPSGKDEHPYVERAREQATSVGQPQGSKVM